MPQRTVLDLRTAPPLHGVSVTDHANCETMVDAWLKPHALRDTLQRELHAAPYPVVRAPLKATFLASFTGEARIEQGREHLCALCQRYGLKSAAPGATFWVHDFGDFQVRWERHAEFYTYTFLAAQEVVGGFEEPIEAALPEDWLRSMPGEVIVALHVAFVTADQPEKTRDELHDLFEDYRLIGSHVVEENATVWTALRTHSDGFGRIFIQDHQLTDCRAGRLLQRLFEIETYRTMALLGFPLALEVAPQLTDMDARLGRVIQDLASAATVAEEQDLLARISTLATEVEQIRACTSHRFRATQTYRSEVERRLSQIQETQILGIQTLAEFLDRRMWPVLNNCMQISERAEDVSRRIDRANDMLRTRIDVALEAQNQLLLTSMNRRAHVQLRLQQTVEGLSVVALSYYLLGLVKDCAEAAQGLGMHLQTSLVTGACLPIALAASALGLRYAHKQIDKHD